MRGLDHFQSCPACDRDVQPRTPKLRRIDPDQILIDRWLFDEEIAFAFSREALRTVFLVAISATRPPRIIIRSRLTLSTIFFDLVTGSMSSPNGLCFIPDRLT